MFHALTQLFEFRTMASDGELGLVVDCYFDDAEWAVRYFVISESDLVTNTKFLIARVAVARIDWRKKQVFVKENKLTIFDSPEFTEDMPVSRQYEIALHRYYEWPVYWGQVSFMDDESVTGTRTSLPEGDVVELDGENLSPEEIVPGEDTVPDQELEGNFREPVDDELQQMEFGQSTDEGTFTASLQSVIDLVGYTLRAREGELGVVRDFVINDRNLTIEYIIVDSEVRNEIKRFFVPNSWVTEISWQSREIRVDVKGDSIINAPPYGGADPVPEDYIDKLLAYFDRLEAP